MTGAVLLSQPNQPGAAQVQASPARPQDPTGSGQYKSCGFSLGTAKLIYSGLQRQHHLDTEGQVTGDSCLGNPGFSSSFYSLSFFTAVNQVETGRVAKDWPSPSRATEIHALKPKRYSVLPQVGLGLSTNEYFWISPTDLPA